MLNRTAAVLASVALVGGLTIPASAAVALEPTVDQPDDVDVTLPTPAGSDDDGDGLIVTSADADLVSGVESSETTHEHESHADDSHSDDISRVFDLDSGVTRVDLQGAPDSLVLGDVIDGTTVAVRWSEDGAWSDWMELAAESHEGPDGAPDPRPGIGPIWLGGSVSEVELRIIAGPAQQIELIGIHDHVDETPGVVGIRSSVTAPSAPVAVGGGPYRIRSRSRWDNGAEWDPNNDSECDDPPEAASFVQGVIVHHTAGRNDYSRSQVPDIIYQIWRFHTNEDWGRGWCDIGYNFVVDKFGRVWEGRTDSLKRPVVGAHAGGYNTGSVGVSTLGDYRSVSPSASSLHGTARVAGFAAQKYGIDPPKTITWKGYKDADKGISNPDRRLPTISGHRNFGSTSCPGGYLYDRLPRIRSLSRGYGVVPTYIREFLSRRATSNDVSRVAGDIFSSGYKAAALDLAHSVEYAGLIVDQFYRDVLGRDPDAEGRAYWVGRLADGMRVEDAAAYFYGSPEYYDGFSSPEAYVTELYNVLLHREPDQDGLEYWSRRLRAGMRPPAVSIGFYRSIESRQDRVTRLYRRFLDRRPDPSGHRYWSELLLDSDDIELAAFLASSEEYIHKALS